jgi:DNA-binding beta-propeller fold protein YncE
VNSKRSLSAFITAAVVSTLVGCATARPFDAPADQPATQAAGWVDAHDGGDASKTITASFASGRHIATVQSPNLLSSVDHVDYVLYRSTTQLATKTMSGATLTGSVTFGHIRQGVTYTVQIQAYNAPASSQANLISLPSMTNFSMVSNNDSVTLAANSFVVTLANKVFNGHGTLGGVLVSTGGYAPNGFVATQAAAVPAFLAPKGVAYNGTDTLFVADNGAHTVWSYNVSTSANTKIAGVSATLGYANGPGSFASFNAPESVAYDPTRQAIYVADFGNNAIRKIDITSTPVVSTFAGADVGATPSAGAVDGLGIAARFNGPRGIAVDTAGNVYVAETGYPTIRVITPAGMVSTLAGSSTAGNADCPNGLGATFLTPAGLAVSSLTNKLYISDYAAQTIRRLDLATSLHPVITVAGSYLVAGNTDGVGVNAKFSGPRGLALDSNGALYVSDVTFGSIRRIDTGDPNFTTSTLAGGVSLGSKDGYATAATFVSPFGIVYDALNSALFISDGTAIRRID